jgi:hypothetical protein
LQTSYYQLFDVVDFDVALK